MKFQKAAWSILWISMMTILSGVVMGNAADAQPQTLPDAEISGMVAERDISDDKELKPGLSSIYIYKYFRHIDQMPILDPKTTSEKIGSPISVLSHRFGAEDMIFDTGVSRGIGIQMNGFLKFSEAGKYGMLALSNDGIRVEICRKMILTDPDVHSDRLSPPVLIDIPNPGWYPILIQYFQRKGTAAIEMQWKLPGKTEFSVIPAEAYAHIPKPESTP